VGSFLTQLRRYTQLCVCKLTFTLLNSDHPSIATTTNRAEQLAVARVLSPTASMMTEAQSAEMVTRVSVNDGVRGWMFSF